MMGMRNEVLPSFSKSDIRSTQAQEELRVWLEKRLNISGIRDTAAISQFVFNFLHFTVIRNTLELPDSSADNGSMIKEQQEIEKDDKKRMKQILLHELINLSNQVYLLFIYTTHVDKIYVHIRQYIHTLMHAYLDTRTIYVLA